MTFMDQHTFEVYSPPMLIPRYHVKAFVTITTLRQGSRYNFQYIYIYNCHLRAAVSYGEGATEK